MDADSNAHSDKLPSCFHTLDVSDRSVMLFRACTNLQSISKIPNYNQLYFNPVYVYWQKRRPGLPGAICSDPKPREPLKSQSFWFPDIAAQWSKNWFSELANPCFLIMIFIWRRLGEVSSQCQSFIHFQLSVLLYQANKNHGSERCTQGEFSHQVIRFPMGSGMESRRHPTVFL